jgi:putative lipoprotein
MCTAALLAAGSCRTARTPRANPGADTSLPVDTRWRPVALYGEPVADDTEAFITFSAEDHRVAGHGGCNLFTGTYHPGKDGEIRFSQMVFTRKMCLGQNIEDTFSAALTAVARYALHGSDTLVFYDDAGTELVRFGK